MPHPPDGDGQRGNHTSFIKVDDIALRLLLQAGHSAASTGSAPILDSVIKVFALEAGTWALEVIGPVVESLVEQRELTSSGHLAREGCVFGVLVGACCAVVVTRRILLLAQ